MSLFVGNISSHVHHSELERVFRRFGRSNLELKDGYGFVVYDAVRDAEKALRALKGRIICGEHLSITWSRKQRPLRRVSGKEFPRNGYVNRVYRKEKDLKGKFFEEWEDNTKDMQKHANEEEAINNDSFISEKGRDDAGENDIFEGERKHQNLEEALLDERCVVEPIPLENDRWGEPLSGASNEYDMIEERTNLQNYDPYSDNRNKGDVRESEKRQKLKSTDSYTANSSQERVLKHRSRDEIQMEYMGFGKSSERCFKCRRAAGHVMCDCRSKAALSGMNKFKRVVPKQKTERNFRDNEFMRFKAPRETNWSRRDFSRENRLQRKDFGSDRIMGHVSRRFHHKTERFSGNRQKHSRNLPDYRKEDQTMRKTRKGDNRIRTDSISQPTGVRDKSQSSFLHSESRHGTHSNSSNSCSRSSFSKSDSSRSDSPLAGSPHSYSPSHSDSRRLRSRSVSSNARSQSISDHSMSGKPTAKSRSPSANLQSLSVSLSPCIRKSSVSTQLGHGSYDASNAKQSLKNALPFDSHTALSEKTREKSTSNANLEDHLKLAVKIDNDLRVRIVQDEEKEQQGKNTKDIGIFNPSESGGKRETASIYKEKSHSDETPDKHNILEGDIMKDEKSKSSVLEIVNLPADTTTQPVVDNSRTVHEKGIDDPMLSKANVKAVGHISLQEAKLILNYSNKLPIEETEHGSSVESYFGAARLWPLEVIQYRRLKRGAISTANYARRMTQNETFGIVDKYVRSSSGWWESESHEI